MKKLLLSVLTFLGMHSYAINSITGNWENLNIPVTSQQQIENIIKDNNGNVYAVGTDASGSQYLPILLINIKGIWYQVTNVPLDGIANISINNISNKIFIVGWKNYNSTSYGYQFSFNPPN